MPLCRSLGAAAWPRGLVLARCDLVLCSQRGTVTRSPSTAAVTHRWHNLPPALGRGKALCLPLQSLWRLLHKAGGGKKTFPQQKVQRRSGSGSLYCRSPEREGGAGFELPAARSEPLYKAAAQLGERDTVRGFKVVTLANVLDGRKELFFFPSLRYGVSIAWLLNRITQACHPR